MLNALRADKDLKLSDLNEENIPVFRKSKKKDYKEESQMLAIFRQGCDFFETSKSQSRITLPLPSYDCGEM